MSSSVFMGGGISQFFKPHNKAIKTDEGDDVGQASLPCSGPETADSHVTDSGHQDPLKCLQENLPIIPVTFPEEQDVEGILKYRDNTEESYSGIDEDDDEAIGNEILGPCVDVVEPKLQKPPGPSDLSQSPCEEPMQPYLRKYPGHVVGIIERRFSYKWFNFHEWLEYSRATDSVFCYYCRLFTMIPQDLHNDAFTQSGFRAWNRCSGSDPRNNAFLKHKNSEGHRLAVERHHAYKNMRAAGKTVVHMIDSEHKKQVLENRHYMRTVYEVLRLTATHNLPQRGHRESDDSNNRGNFLEILHLMGIHDDIVRRRLEHGPDNAKYTHHSIQEVLIQIMADLIIRQVKDEIMVQQHFDIICDETKDMSKKEQISLVVRYLHKGSIHEEFLGFTYAERLDAESLCNYILEKLKTAGIDIKNCVLQSYDGASVMSGRLSGVQVRIKEHAECAEYVHCYAHRLNLVIVDTCKQSHAADYFALLQKLYIFVSGSFVHPKWLSLQNDLYPDEKPIELKRLSDTRWSAQISAVRAVRSRLSVIVALLQQIGDEERGDRAIEARSILNQMDIKFTFCLEIFNDLLREMKSTSDSLQRTQLNVSATCDLINNVRHYLQQKRTPDEFKEHFDAAKQLAESNELQTTIAFKSRSHSVNSINTLIGRLFHSSSFTLSECIDRNAKVFSFLLLV